ncbi:hypothetical protein HCN51_48305 [Nonomuraea sp. FMUSA5-5]|uniref:Secreted protein n=1 Tax=Nonomuraea composti TaxID=2720023 RepID=A0ABX1BL68_9ACTN|nr:hypothetical protein [Nonomuraea sp. FMUSA5-5]NJP97145.1 hypothetical protein [Nonomuraea sp. FMUSA5-5]
MTARRTTATISSLALALTVTLATPALAALGTFTYTYPTPNGTSIADLTDPPSKACINIPEVARIEDSAHTPINHTSSTVTMFTGIDCTGDYYSLRPGGRASSRLLLKSVVFS